MQFVLIKKLELFIVRGQTAMPLCHHMEADAKAAAGSRRSKKRSYKRKTRKY